MLILIFFACLVTNISATNSTGAGEIKVELFNNDICKVKNSYEFPPGTRVTVAIYNKSNWNIKSSCVEKTVNNITGECITINFDGNGFGKTIIGNETRNYTLFFRNTYEAEQQIQNDPIYRPLCNTSVIILSPPTPPPESSEFQQTPKPELSKDGLALYMSIGGVLAGIIIIALSATTMYYKRQVRTLKNQNNLIPKVEKPDVNDPDLQRYCTGPRKGKSLDTNKSRASDIYEDPNTLGVNLMPPALPTSPRPNRNNLAPLPQHSPSGTIKSIGSSHPTLPRPQLPEKDIKVSMANRPPQPLPQDEFYSETQEDEVYEEPPEPERPTPTLPRPGIQDKINKMMPEKPRLENIVKPKPENIFKPKPENMNRPKLEITPKPTLERTVKPRGNLGKAFEEKFGNKLPTMPAEGINPSGMKTLPKPVLPQEKPTLPRNKMVQVPVRQIPDNTLTKKAPLTKPKPKPPPKTPPAPTFEQEVQLFNQNRHDIPRDDSSDDEWTYEDLPKFNIYNV